MTLRFPKAYFESKIESPVVAKVDNIVQGFSVSDAPAVDLATSPEQVSKLEFASWLPFAAKTYNISPNIEDYILKPMPICPSGIPNRNGIGFPIQELVKYQPPPIARQAYKAWTGCPVHLEHKNKVHTDALGVIFDTILTPITSFGNGKFWKVMGLIGVDKTKNPDIAGKVLRGAIKTGSMGTLADYFSCSVCGAEVFDDKFKNCNHVSSTKDVNWRVVDFEGKKHLAFLNAHELSPIEYSLVEEPAWVIALSDHQFMW